MGWLKGILSFIATNWFRIGIFVCFVTIAMSVRYYYVDFLPMQAHEKAAMESLKQASETAKIEDSRTQLNNCMMQASLAYSTNWNDQCKSFGVDTRKADCLLPSRQSTQVEKWLQDAKDECFKLYPLK